MTYPADPTTGAWRIEHQCPQCGAPVTLEETDRILLCPYCRTKLCIAVRGYPRFCLPPDPALTGDITYVPYWRLRGLTYTVSAGGITHRHVDTNVAASGVAGLPASLGVRPQAMKLRYAYALDKGRFVKPLAATVEHSRFLPPAGPSGGPPTFIGEQMSIIYAPLFEDKGRLCDAILRRPLAAAAGRIPEDLLEHDAVRPDWQVSFLGTLCPACGWQLEGEKDACILLCRNCASVWSCSGASLERVACTVAACRDTRVRFLPFWRIKARIDGVPLATAADLIRLANLPKVPTARDEDRPCYFWSPAFKINPALFLRWLRQMTAIQPETGEPPLRFEAPFLPATLGKEEATETVAVTIGSLVANKRRIAEILSAVRIVPVEHLLVYHPFLARQRELVHATLGIAIDLQALAFGSSL